MKTKIMLAVLFTAVSLKPAISVNNAETPQIPVTFLNSLNVNHEKNSDSNNIKVNVLKLYAQIAGYVNVRSYTKEEEMKMALYTIRINELIKEKNNFIDNNKLGDVFKDTGRTLAQVKEEENKYNEKLKIFNTQIQDCRKELDSINKISAEDSVTINDKTVNNAKNLWIVPIEIYMNQRIKEKSTPTDIMRYFNADFMNPVGGLLAGQIYTKMHLTKYSSDTRYWTIKPFINSSWSRTNDINNNKTYNIGIGRIGIMASFIAPLFNENMDSDAGTIRISGGILGCRYLLGKKNVKQIYALAGKELPGRNQIMICVGAQANITNYFSFSCEYIKSVWATKRRKMDNSISVSLTAARI